MTIDRHKQRAADEQPTERERGSATGGSDLERSGNMPRVAATRRAIPQTTRRLPAPFTQGSQGAADNKYERWRMRLEQLRELDGQIMRNADDLTKRIQRRERPAALSVIANLLRNMFDRRAYLLGELEKAGISEAEAYRENKKWGEMPCLSKSTGRNTD